MLILLETTEQFFHILLFHPKYSLCTFFEMFHLVTKILQKKRIRSKREYQMRVCLDLKTDLSSCYGLNCVHP